MAICVACERRPLYDDLGGNVFIEIEIETEIETEETRSEVAGMVVNFYSPGMHDREHHNFVDYTGGFVTVEPDVYDIMVYNYDTEYTMLRNEDHRINAEAYTNAVPANIRRSFEMLMKAIAAARGEDSRTYALYPIVNQPDHLYVGNLEEVTIPYSLSNNDVLHLYIKARTILETYRLYVNNVQGMQFIRTSEAFVTGQANAKHIYDQELTGGPATVYVPMEASSQTQLAAKFTTFGKYDERVYVVLRVVDLEDRIYTWEWDVTDQVDSGSHVIIVDQGIQIEPTGGSGGFGPELQDWQNIITDIKM